MCGVLLHHAKSGFLDIGRLCALGAIFAAHPGRGRMARRGLTIIACATDGMTIAVPHPTGRTTTITAVAKRTQF